MDDLEEFLMLYERNYSLEEIFEMLDLSVYEALENLFDNGMIDEELLKELIRNG